MATDIQGVSCRRMIDALIAGERDPEVLAELALTRMRPKIPELGEALVGRFDDHHALLARMHLAHMDHLTRTEERLDQEVNRLMAPFCEAATRLLTIPGIGKRVAEVVVAEVGTDMSRFPSAATSPPGPGCARGTTSRPASADQARPARATLRFARRCARPPGLPPTPKTATSLLSTGGSCAASGKKNEGKAIFASAHSLLVIIWHVLSNGCDYEDLGGDYFERRNDADARQRYLVCELHKLGHIVTLEPAA